MSPKVLLYVGLALTILVALAGLWAWHRLGFSDTSYLVVYLAGAYHTLWHRQRFADADRRSTPEGR